MSLKDTVEKEPIEDCVRLKALSIVALTLMASKSDRFVPRNSFLKKTEEIWNSLDLRPASFIHK